MVVRTVVGITVFLVVAITIARGIKAADWLLMRQASDGAWHQRGPVLGQETACLTALASDGIVVASGTRLRCERITATKEAKR